MNGILSDYPILEGYPTLSSDCLQKNLQYTAGMEKGSPKKR